MNLSKIVELFNIGKLKLDDAEWFARRGYAVVCADGNVESVTLERIDT